MHSKPKLVKTLDVTACWKYGKQRPQQQQLGEPVLPDRFSNSSKFEENTLGG